MPLKLEIDREADGRCSAEVNELPGVLAYGTTREEAVTAAQALALRVVADRIEHGEMLTQLSAFGLREPGGQSL